MKRTCLLALAVAVAVSAQTRPNFSGTWELMVEKSDFGGVDPPKKVTNVIEHKEPRLKVKSTMVVPQGQYSAELIYHTTGVEDVNPAHSTVTRTKTTWEKQELVFDGWVEAGFNVIQFKERWRLADGGKTLINQRVMTVKAEQIPQKLIYVKK